VIVIGNAMLRMSEHRNDAEEVTQHRAAVCKWTLIFESLRQLGPACIFAICLHFPERPRYFLYPLVAMVVASSVFGNFLIYVL